MSDHQQFSQWDAAYVLGALSASDREAFEAHLESCAECARSVSELAMIPGLLGKLDLAGPAQEWPEPPEDLASRTRAAAAVELTRARNRRRGWWITGGALAAAAALMLALVLPAQLTSPDDRGPAIVMAQVRTSPLQASIRLASKDWGTEISMNCTYRNTGYGTAQLYGLYVVDTSGHSTQVSTWSASPGVSAELTASTAVPMSRIRQVQVRDVTGTVLLTARPGA